MLRGARQGSICDEGIQEDSSSQLVMDSSRTRGFGYDPLMDWFV